MKRWAVPVLIPATGVAGGVLLWQASGLVSQRTDVPEWAEDGDAVAREDGPGDRPSRDGGPAVVDLVPLDRDLNPADGRGAEGVDPLTQEELDALLGTNGIRPNPLDGNTVSSAADPDDATGDARDPEAGDRAVSEEEAIDAEVSDLVRAARERAARAAASARGDNVLAPGEMVVQFRKPLPQSPFDPSPLVETFIDTAAIANAPQAGTPARREVINANQPITNPFASLSASISPSESASQEDEFFISNTQSGGNSGGGTPTNPSTGNPGGTPTTPTTPSTPNTPSLPAVPPVTPTKSTPATPATPIAPNAPALSETVVPSPAAFAAGLVLLGALSTRRRRDGLDRR